MDRHVKSYIHIIWLSLSWPQANSVYKSQCPSFCVYVCAIGCIPLESPNLPAAYCGVLTHPFQKKKNPVALDFFCPPPLSWLVAPRLLCLSCHGICTGLAKVKSAILCSSGIVYGVVAATIKSQIYQVNAKQIKTFLNVRTNSGRLWILYCDQ